MCKSEESLHSLETLNGAWPRCGGIGRLKLTCSHRHVEIATMYRPPIDEDQNLQEKIFYKWRYIFKNTLETHRRHDHSIVRPIAPCGQPTNRRIIIIAEGLPKQQWVQVPHWDSVSGPSLTRWALKHLALEASRAILGNPESCGKMRAHS